MNQKGQNAMSHSHTPNRSGGKYRFFISHSSKDTKLAEDIAAILTNAGHYVKRMADLEPSREYTKKIKQSIERSHVMIPVLTKASVKSQWVQQEIGYAIARYIPVVSVETGIEHLKHDHLAFVGQLHAIVISDVAELEKRLLSQKWESIIEPEKEDEWSPSVFSCDDNAHLRSTFLAKTAEEIGKGFRGVRIRQLSALTSFSVPRALTDGIWSKLPSEILDRSRALWLNPDERVAFEELVAEGGCDLIIYPFFLPAGYDPDVQRARLLTFHEFLERQKEDQVRVAVSDSRSIEGGKSPGSMTIIGDHWVACSAAVTSSYYTKRQTISTWHAPTVGLYCRNFDREFSELFSSQQRSTEGLTSREYALKQLESAIATLGKGRADSTQV